MKIGKILNKKSDKAVTLYKQLSCDSDIEVLHKYRIHLRKLYAYNETYIRQIDRRMYKKISKLLKKLLHPTATLRDLDLFLFDIFTFNCSQSCKNNLKDALMQLRQVVCKTFKKEILSSKYSKDLEKLNKLFMTKSILMYKISKADVKNIVQDLSQELFDELYKLNQDSSLKKLHLLRIKFKTLHYALMVCKKCDKLSKLTATIKKLQDIFGKIQDSNIRLKILTNIDIKLLREQKNILKTQLLLELKHTKYQLLEYANNIKIYKS